MTVKCSYCKRNNKKDRELCTGCGAPLTNKKERFPQSQIRDEAQKEVHSSGSLYNFSNPYDCINPHTVPSFLEMGLEKEK